MAGLEDLLKALPIDDIAAKFGVDGATAEKAVSGLIPAILGGLEANAKDPAAASSLTKALESHSADLVDGGVKLDDVNTEDGAKIASHIFGENQDQVVAKLGEVTGAGSGLISKLLPTLAPVAMSWIAKMMSGGGKAAGIDASAPAGGIDISSILGSILGGGGAQQSAGGGLGSIISSIFGGGSKQSSAGGMDISNILGSLGGLLGGGTR
ncbi:MAG: DUF937 domain-containing protein [Cellulomonadaceae bacterium]|jgi:hypothetical protein|nr:DUF937 domain-containing protein [Cellulomonadaceae bacterium]